MFLRKLLQKMRSKPEPPSPLLSEVPPIALADVEALLEMVSRAYVERRGDLLMESLAPDAVIIVKKRLGNSVSTVTQSGTDLIHSNLGEFMLGLRYSQFLMRLHSVLLSSDNQWKIRCLVESVGHLPQGQTISRVTDEILTITARGGRPVVTQAEITSA